MMRWRNDSSFAVGGMDARHADGGLNAVCVMAKGPKTSCWQRRQGQSSAMGSGATPRMMKPISLYLALEPRSLARGLANAAERRSSRVLVRRNSFSYAANPE